MRHLDVKSISDTVQSVALRGVAIEIGYGAVVSTSGIYFMKVRYPRIFFFIFDSDNSD